MRVRQPFAFSLLILLFALLIQIVSTSSTNLSGENFFLTVREGEVSSPTCGEPNRLCLITVLPSSQDFLPAFPGAEGFGSVTVGGHGGRVIEVTN